MQKTNDINDFLKNYPIYKEFLYIEDYVRSEDGLIDPFDFNGTSFDYFCEEEKSVKTFELAIPVSTSEYYAKFPGDNILGVCYDEANRLNYTQHFYGICKSCQKKQLDLVLSIYSDKEFPKDRNIVLRMENEEYIHVDIAEKKHIKVYLKKVGIFPEPKVEIDKRIQKYFDRETNNWYYKGIKLYSQNFGIGAFAYFRRIIEKELFKIFEDVSTLPSTNSKLNKLIKEYNTTSQISALYKNSLTLLPKSLQILGDNPFEILYRLTSQGLHNLKEEECLENANKIHKILDFVVIKINEEKSDLLEIRNIIKDLRKEVDNTQ